MNPADAEQQVTLGDLTASQAIAAKPLRRSLRRLARTYAAVTIDAVASGAIKNGAKVVVIGRAEPFGDNLIVYGMGASSTQIFVDIHGLTPAQDIAVKRRCAAFCEAVVAGRVAPVLGSPGLTATIVRPVRATRHTAVEPNRP